MVWVKLIAAIVIGLPGLTFLGQGLGFIPGSYMSGQLMWAIIGALLVAIAAWLVWSVFQSRRVSA